MPSIDEVLAFTSPAETHSFAGLLFDVDGTIIDSTNAIVKHWHRSVRLLGAVYQPQSDLLQCRPRNGCRSPRDLGSISWKKDLRRHKALRSQQSQLGVSVYEFNGSVVDMC